MTVRYWPTSDAQSLTLCTRSRPDCGGHKPPEIFPHVTTPANSEVDEVLDPWRKGEGERGAMH
jgi:hypothetical protein